MSSSGQHNEYDSEPDRLVTEFLKSHYAAPQNEAFWVRQERRIMQALPPRLSKVARDVRPAWQRRVSRLRTTDFRAVGLIAATLALLAAGASFVRNHAADARAREIAAREIVESTQPLDDIMLTRVRPHLPADAPERYLHPLDY